MFLRDGLGSIMSDIIDRVEVEQVAAAIGSSLMPDNRDWVNRFTVESQTSSATYTVAQKRSDGTWGCSCRGWIHHRRCKHLTDVLHRLAVVAAGCAPEEDEAPPADDGATATETAPADPASCAAEAGTLEEGVLTVGTGNPAFSPWWEGGTTEEVLWELWAGTDWPARLRRSVQAGGGAARMAHRDLDAVCALFEVAAKAEEQRGHTSAAVFLDTLTAQRIPADTLAESGVRGDAVRLLTAHRSKGLEWRLVVVAHVQEEAWPDLRRRAGDPTPYTPADAVARMVRFKAPVQPVAAWREAYARGFAEFEKRVGQGVS